MFGEVTVGHMTMDELQALERHLEIWVYHIRSAQVNNSLIFLLPCILELNSASAPSNHNWNLLYQMQIMFQEIQSLKNKVSPAHIKCLIHHASAHKISLF